MMKTKQHPLLISFLMSFIVVVIHSALLIYKFIDGIGLSGAKDDFNRQLYSMHLTGHWPIISFTLVIFLAYFFYSTIVYFFVKFLARRSFDGWLFPVLIWLIGYGCILICNSYLFPNSFFSFYSKSLLFFSNNAIKSIYVISSILLSLIFLGALLEIVHLVYKKRILMYSIVFVLAGLVFYKYFLSHLAKETVTGENNQKKPNVIILMYCSFKADLLNDFPNFKKFSDESVWFKNAYSSTARSGPSTFAILSGLYPASSHYFENLNWLDKRIPFNQLITYRFQKMGYQTIFFTNMNLFRRMDDKLNWGFDKIYANPTSVYALILSKINDFPLTNLLFQFRFAQFLFPYNYNNVDDTVHYREIKFVQSFGAVIKNLNRDKPVFLFLNDESLHYPYQMASMPLSYSYDERYKTLMNIADLSFKDYLSILKKNNLLDNAILIFTADHGEGIGDDAKTNSILNNIQNNPSFNSALIKEKKYGYYVRRGHGTDAVMSEQFNVPLVFHFYGNQFKIPMSVKNQDLVSTTNIAPTLFELLNIQNGKFDTKSLFINNQIKTDSNNMIFVNTGILYSGRIVFPGAGQNKALKKFVQKMKALYYVSKSGEFGLKQEILDQLVKEISVGIYWKNFTLAYLPVAPNEQSNMSVMDIYCVVNQKTGSVLLLNSQEINQFSENPDEAQLSKLEMTKADFIFLYQNLMNYRNELLK